VFENVRPINLVVEQVEAIGRLRLRLAIELPLKGANLIRRCKAHRQSPRFRPSSAGMSEVRGHCSAGITGLDAPTPLSDSRSGRHPEDDVATRAPPETGLSCMHSSLSSDVPFPIPRRTETVHLSILPGSCCLPHHRGGSAASALALSRPAQASPYYGPPDRFSRPMATFVTRLRSGRSPRQTARQLPDSSTSIRVEPSSTRDTR
jgi:hypothetical protein